MTQVTPLPGSAPNRFRQAAEAALTAVVAERRELTEAFSALFAEADAGGWAGRAADDWWRGAAGQRATALGALDSWVDACRHLLLSEPVRVAHDDPRARHPGPAPAPRAGQQ